MREISRDEAIDLAVNPVAKVYMLVRVFPDTTLDQISNTDHFYYDDPNVKIEEKPKVKKPKAVKPKDTTRKTVDHGKICALYKAGWNIPKIADEISCSIQTVYTHLINEGLYKKNEEDK